MASGVGSPYGAPMADFRVVICGGGIAAVEGLLRLRDLAGEAIDVELIAPNDDLVYRPLAVREPWRGQGLGRALLLTAFGAFHRRGQTGAALSVDTANVTGAVRLYEGVGMHATRRLDTYERPLDG